MTEQIASGIVLVAGMFVAAVVTGYVLLNRGHHQSDRHFERGHGDPLTRG